MTKQEFIEALQDELEIAVELSNDTVLKDTDEWDSMTAMVLIGFVAEKFDKTLTSDDLNDITTIDTLIEKIGIDKFD